MTLLTTIALALVQAAAQPSDSAYFQQGVDYRIEARLDEATDVLHGRARLKYVNNAPARIDTLYFHLSLNAFRPNSAWARRDLEFDERRFQDLGPDEHAFTRLNRVRVGGRPATPRFLGPPDSTVVAVPLAAPLATGDSTTVLIDFESRLSTLPRRQGRRGRSHDFAQWYPRIAVYDRGGWRTRPLLPQGEFYGEFGAYDVTLDVAADQVIGATGVPVEGDPGWTEAAAAGHTPALRRDAYTARPAEPLGLLAGAPADGRKRVRWRAEAVHHFAWSTSPDYIYEGGAFEDVAIHVLYRPGDEEAWGNGIAVRRTAAALAFFDSIFGDYAWPQLTNLHRIENGGTEFPMMIMDGNAGEGLIVHETAHQYVHGILANNEWLEGWLDEGFASFLGNWYEEAKGADPMPLWAPPIQSIGAAEAAGATQPVGLPSAEFRDYDTYGAMTYTKGSIVLHMARALLGDAAFRQAMRHYYEGNQLRHVRGDDLEAALEAFYPQGELDWFFDQWIDRTATLDYRVEAARTEQAGGRWRTTVDIVREGDAWMPVELRVGDVVRRLDSRERRQTVVVETASRPDRVTLDPRALLLETNKDNNTREVGAG